MYARKVKGRTLTLGVSGKLWEGSLVMIDEETQSLWSQLLGEAMQGPLTGTKLPPIPSVMTDWKSWKSNHPQTTLVFMSRITGNYTTDFYSADTGLIIGMAEKGRSRIWSLSDLFDHTVVNDLFGKTAVLVVFHKPSFTAIVYERKIDGRELTFERRRGKLIDREVGCEWNMFTGEALTGKLKGKRLKRLHTIISDHAAWSIFHPLNGSLWSPPTQKSGPK